MAVFAVALLCRSHSSPCPDRHWPEVVYSPVWSGGCEPAGHGVRHERDYMPRRVLTISYRADSHPATTALLPYEQLSCR